MKKRNVALLIGSIVVLCAMYLLFSNYQKKMNKKQSEDTLKKAFELIVNSKNEENLEEIEQEKNKRKDPKQDIILEDGIIGILIIPKLGVKAPIKDGTSQEVMKTSIGHFIESNYWNGNVSLASHNGGTNAHYFENIKNLQENDEVEYITKLGSKKYRINSIYRISSYDWTSINGHAENSGENTITLITCINGLPNYRLCVKGIEV